MNWLGRIFVTGYTWIRQNPIIIFIVLLVLGYNYFYPHVTPQFENIDIFNLASMLAVLDVAYTFILTPAGQIAGWIAITTASAITMFNTGAMFAIFSKRPRPVVEGLRTMFSDRTLEYIALQFIIGLSSAYLLYLELWTVVYIFPNSGWFGVAIILLSVLIAYPLSYVLLSAGAMLIGAKVTVVEKLRYSRILFQKENFKRLATFYCIRIGAEVLVVYVAIYVARLLHVPHLITTLVIVLLITLPLALVRTTGLVLKLGMLKEAAWFKQYFANYYSNNIKSL
ncbi:MAG: hypothetical protein V4436_00980 [Patescibacteria group bacterium]